MTAKELKCLGVALKSLMDANMYDEVRAVISIMAEEEKEEQTEGGKKSSLKA